MIRKRTSHIEVVLKEKTIRDRREINGTKVNPHGLRVGVIKDWDSRWFTTDKKSSEVYY